MIADTLVSIDDGKDDALPTPSRMEFASTALDACVPLARKLFVADRNTAFAFSGQVASLVDFAQQLPNLVEYAKHQERPMRYIGDYANSLTSEGQDLPNVGILGAMVQFDTGRPKIQELYHMGCFDHATLGRCAVAGSGTEWMDAFLAESVSARMSPEIGNCRNIANQVCGALNHRMFRAERGTASRFTWGGYFENIAFDDHTRRWQMGPSTLNLSYVVKPDGTHWKPEQEKWFVAYEPGGLFGRILSVSYSDKGIDVCRNWVIKDVLSLDDLVEPDDTSLFWSKWKPSTVTISFIFEFDSINTLTMTQTEKIVKNSEIIFQFSPDGWQVGMTEEYLRRKVKEILSALPRRG